MENDLIMNEHIYLGLENALMASSSTYGFTKDKSDLFRFNLFHQDTEKFILSDVKCAEYFFNCIKFEEYQLTDVNPLNTLFKLGHKIKTPYSGYSQVKPLFIETMEYIESNISQVMGYEFRELEEYGEDLGLYYDYGPYTGLVNAISMVREKAFVEYVYSMAKILKNIPDIDNLCGENYLVVSNVKLEGIEKLFGKIKLDHSEFVMATFTPLPEGKWRFELNNLGPENNFIHMQAAYKKVVDLLGYSLNADVELYTRIDE